MSLITISIVMLCVAIIGAVAVKRRYDSLDLEAKSIGPDELYALLATKQVLLFDVRQPLDVLAYPEVIRGALRIPPKDAAELSSSYARDQCAVLYCTGLGDKTGLMVLGKVRALNFTQVRLLKGGLEAWKQKGYPVEPYADPFRLDTKNHARLNEASGQGLN